MKNEICILYEDLNKLLSDICELLSEEVKNDKISLKNRNAANQLIDRSKQQLQTISRIASLTTDNDSGSYMDMNKTPEYIDPDRKLNEESQEIYTDVDIFNDAESTSKEGQIMCPYESTPAQELLQATKCGYLDRKEKFLFIEHQKRIYAAIAKPWMMIYATDKDPKPNDILDLRAYYAKANESQKDFKRKDEKCFELVSLRKTKSYQFTATTPKDMLQWVATIERTDHTYHNDFVKQVEETPVEFTDDENIYEKLRDDESHQDTKIQLNQKVFKQALVPSLPPRISRNNYIINRPVPSVPAQNKEKSKEAFPQLERQSILEDDSETIYDMLITDINTQSNSSIEKFNMPERNTTVNNHNEEDEPDVEYDVIQIDMEVTQQNQHTKIMPEGSKTRSENQTLLTKPDVPSTSNTNKSVENSCEDDADLVYDVIQIDTQIPQRPQNDKHSNIKNVTDRGEIMSEEKPEKIKPVVPKTKPKVFHLPGKEMRQNSKINILVQQLTKKSKT